MGEYAEDGKKIVRATHVRAALIEIGRQDLADIAFHNRSDRPAFDWCRFVAQEGQRRPGQWIAPNMVDIIHAVRAAQMWYVTFMPDSHHFAHLPFIDWARVVSGTVNAQQLWVQHRDGICQCPPRDYGRSPNLSRSPDRTPPGVRWG